MSFTTKISNTLNHQVVHPENRLKLLTSLLILVIGFVAVIFTLLNVRDSQDTNVGAIPSGVELFISPSSTTLAPNNEQAFDVFIDTDANSHFEVGALVLEIQYDPNDLIITSFTAKDAPFPTYPFNELVPPNFSNPGVMNVTLGYPTGQTPPGYTSPTPVRIASFTARASSNLGPTVLSFTDNTQVAATNVSGDVADDTLDGATITIDNGQASVPALHFSEPLPANPQTVGQPFTIDIQGSTAGQPIGVVDATLIYDPSVLQVISVVPSDNHPFADFPELDWTSTPGVINVSATIGGSRSNPPPEIILDNTSIVTITFTPLLTTPNTSLDYEFIGLGEENDSNLVQSAFGGDPIDILEQVIPATITVTGPAGTPIPTTTITPIPSATPTPIPHATPTPIVSPSTIPTNPPPTLSPTPTPVPFQVINFILGLQGKLSSAVSKIGIPITLEIPSRNETTVISLNADGSFNYDFVPGTYNVGIKTEGYLRSTYLVSINQGTTTINLSSSPLRAGDFDQSGEINDLDYGGMVLNWSTTNPLYDLDNSGEVNGLDYGAMYQNFGQTDSSL